MLRVLSLAFLLSALQLSQAIDVYISPHNSLLRSTLSPQDASSALSRHLGVEVFEPLRDATRGGYNDESFVGKGSYNGLLMTMDEVDVKAVLPSATKPSFRLASPNSATVSSLSTVVSTYLHRAQHVYASVYTDEISWNLNAIDSLVTFFESAETPSFAAVELQRLSDLRESYGVMSEEYTEAADKIRAFLQRVYDSNINLALLTYSSSSNLHAKRQPQASQSPLPPNGPPPQEPIGSVSTCFATADACTDGTNSCSERGQCISASKSGRTCYICSCDVTKTGEGSKVKTDTWVGQSCERKDVSGPFVLLTGVAIVMILLVFGSISLLSSVGDNELPSTLLATAVHVKKD